MRLRTPDPSAFDPNGAGVLDAGIFGLPYQRDESSIILVPVPWEATTSYGRGTVDGPAAISDASPQLDLLEPGFLQLGLGRPWKYGIHMLDVAPELEKHNERACALALPIIAEGGRIAPNSALALDLEKVNDISDQVNAHVQQICCTQLDAGHFVGIVGGDHASPLGLMRELGSRYPGMGILHIDAHADLRIAYEGFKYSHASIMYNALQEVPQLESLVQVAIRDFCEEELDCIQRDKRVHTFFDSELVGNQAAGRSWREQCSEIVGKLPHDVYVSFDIDGLDPQLCPSTGTPVPGGLSFAQASFLLETLATSGRRIVGFDLCEVAPGPTQWDGNVGARILYKLCAASLYSQGARDNQS